MSFSLLSKTYSGTGLALKLCLEIDGFGCLGDYSSLV